jgi:hypothetical protein
MNLMVDTFVVDGKQKRCKLGQKFDGTGPELNEKLSCHVDRRLATCDGGHRF